MDQLPDMFELVDEAGVLGDEECPRYATATLPGGAPPAGGGQANISPDDADKALDYIKRVKKKPKAEDVTVSGNTPGMQLYVQEYAEHHECPLEHAKIRALEETLYRPSVVPLPKTSTYAATRVSWLPGHRLNILPGEEVGYGPRYRRRVMVITSKTLAMDMKASRHLSSKAGDKMWGALSICGVQSSDIYVTSAVKFSDPYPKMASMPAAWQKEGLWHLHQEIARVKPEFILCSGAAALKAVLGSKASVYSYRSAFTDFKGAKLMATADVHGLVKNDEKEPGFLADIRFFSAGVLGQDGVDVQTHYEYVKTEDHLRDVLSRCAGAMTVAIDCEWAGESPNRGGWLSTIQFSVKARESFVVVMKSVPGGYEFSPSQDKAVTLLRDFLCRPGVVIVGQNLRADMMWLHSVGIDIADAFAERGFDTLLASHKIAENDDHDLTALTVRYTKRKRYDYEAQLMLDAGHLHHTLPDSVAHPYAAADTDVLMELYPVLNQILWDQHVQYCLEHHRDPYEAVGSPEDAELKGTPYAPTLWNVFRYIDMAVSAPLHEIEREGLPVDEHRLGYMSAIFTDKAESLKQQLQKMVGDPNFNPASSPQTQKVLFDPKNKDGEPFPLRLGLEPVKAAGKANKTWFRAIEDGDVEWVEGFGWSSSYMQAATDGETIGLLQAQCDHPFLPTLQKYRDAATMIKNILTKPIDPRSVLVPMSKSEVKKQKEVGVGKGLGGYIDYDGRVRTRLSQVSETGRLKSSSINLLNIPKGKEAAFYKLFKGDDVSLYPIRTCMYPPMGGYYLEADYQSAELWTLAYIADDPVFKAALHRKDAKGNPVSFHTTSMMLYFKIKERFGYSLEDVMAILEGDTPETKQFKAWRTGAKTISFGIPYGRSAAAIAQAVKSEGIVITNDEAQEWVDGYYDAFARAGEYLEFCRESVMSPGYLDNPYGRRRRFTQVDDKAVMAAQERESTNFPIQSTVADSLWRALVRLYRRRNELGLRLRIVLPIHDAILLWVPYEELVIAHKLLQWAMVDAVGAEVPGTGLRYGIDTEINVRWGEKASPWDVYMNTRGEVDQRPSCAGCGKVFEDESLIVKVGRKRLCSACAS